MKAATSPGSRKDRDSRGGGIGVYINDDIKCEHISITDYIGDDSSVIEQFWLKLQFKSSSVALGLLYRPPKANLNSAVETLDTLLSHLSTVYDHIIILGDRDAALIKYKHNRTNQNWTEYTELRNYAPAAQHREKAGYLQHLQETNNSSSLYKGIRNLNMQTKKRNHIPMPKNQEEWLQIAEGFEKRWNFPHCLGSIDEKHCILQTPANSGSDYFNYKSTFSIVLLALVDYHNNFLFADVGCQGRISDGGVFAHTSFCKTLYAGTLKLPEESILPGRTENVPYVFVADDAFALHKHILKPYGGTHENNSSKRTFNYRLSRARRVVENAFGILFSLRKPILLKEDNAALVVLSCVYLHNFLRRSKTSRNIYAPPGSFDIEPNTRRLKTSKWVSAKLGAEDKCLDKEEVTPKKYFNFNGKSQWIKVDTSSRVTHQLNVGIGADSQQVYIVSCKI
ncbi:unnamed protein product [Acanthoscelides obtectus]|uniref:DDE Tnp4 domain-containing protein n=1 Tax=Acanthoscelides obtectus TaxID=200917 RepID=A0A9P0PV08_ACAOB|nr:unnamed protein product [Acanthoscelides obtectus]CAK1660835.1 Protein ALP1-like [Acanthoscelides obtectus]